MLISIIVPVYNTGEILRTTIDSILNQTYKDFELILVDDGSTDDSGSVCDEYSSKDSRVIALHKKNGGICDARNYGLLKAKGNYITFCDHDDIYDPKLLEKEILNITANRADAIVVGKEFITGNRSKKFGKDFSYGSDEIKKNFIDLYNCDIFSNIWNILYSKTLIANHSFDSTFKRGYEDINFNLDVLLTANKLCGISDCLYHHVQRENLSTSAKIHKDLIPQMVDNNNRLYEIVNEYSNLNEKLSTNYYIAQGGQIKTALIYSVKCGATYKQYVSVFDNLRYVVTDTKIELKDINKSVIFYIFRKHNQKKLSFILSKIFVSIFRK